MKLKKIILLASLLVFLTGFLYFQNNSIVITEKTIHSSTLPESFNGFQIAHLSDLHNKSFGDNQHRLIHKVEQTNPDVIVFTGDLVGWQKDGLDAGILLMEKLVEIAPTYFVTGNHEKWAMNEYSLESQLVGLGVRFLREELEMISIDGEMIQLIGIDDRPGFHLSEIEDGILEGVNLTLLEKALENEFSILLAHRPEIFSLYSEYDVDLVFSGHAHGGQIRLPFIGGLFSPNQGILPPYTSGSYNQNNTTMIVNRGLGNSSFPFRIFNRPEIGLITLTLE
ncbi:metallophosphoesterase [Bacillus sp. FJAT-45350]|uniref:metallophosphoesterase n=1 Tax=Bacillus sp. FJAT-45350 TaxID=2011014 RepID=UPI001C53671D|nr:metallophosphoesterase [Bacillus sp. FJAT-45350]